MTINVLRSMIAMAMLNGTYYTNKLTTVKSLMWWAIGRPLWHYCYSRNGAQVWGQNNRRPSRLSNGWRVRFEDDDLYIPSSLHVSESLKKVCLFCQNVWPSLQTSNYLTFVDFRADDHYQKLESLKNFWQSLPVLLESWTVVTSSQKLECLKHSTCNILVFSCIV